MALELTPEQEKVLLSIIDREAAALKAAADLVAAQAAYATAEAQWLAERQAAIDSHQAAEHDAVHTINATWAATLTPLRAAVTAAEAAAKDATAPIDPKKLGEAK